MTGSSGKVEKLTVQELVSVSDSVQIKICLIEPSNIYPYYTIFTTGMSDVAMTLPKGHEHYRYAELTMHLSPEMKIDSTTGSSHQSQNLWPIQWMRKFA